MLLPATETRLLDRDSVAVGRLADEIGGSWYPPGQPGLQTAAFSLGYGTILPADG